MPRLQTILHPTDLSEASRAAFKYACELARDGNGRLIALFVMEPIPPLMVDGVILPSDSDYTRAAAHDQLHALQPTEKGIRFDRLFRDGPAAATILSAANEVQADLIVMGTHGRSGFSRLLLGSVAEHVLRGATCPVLFVKMPLAGAKDS